MKGTAKKFEDIFNEECKEALRNGAHLIITGGEPTMQQEKILSLLTYIENNIAKNVFVEVETNGSNIPDRLAEKIDLYNCSPKLSNSGNEKSLRYNPEAIKFINQQNSIFKFVISRMEDWEEIERDFFTIYRQR